MINGYIKSRRVMINDKVLEPGPSQKLVNHSPDGFMWGYGGSGPAQLALALLLHFTGREFALGHYQQFKWDVIAELPKGSFSMTTESVKKWAGDNGWGGDKK